MNEILRTHHSSRKGMGRYCPTEESEPQWFVYENKGFAGQAESRSGHRCPIISFGPLCEPFKNRRLLLFAYRNRACSWIRVTEGEVRCGERVRLEGWTRERREYHV